MILSFTYENVRRWIRESRVGRWCCSEDIAGDVTRWNVCYSEEACSSEKGQRWEVGDMLTSGVVRKRKR